MSKVGDGMIAFIHKKLADPEFADRVIKTMSSKSTVNPHSPTAQIAFELACKLKLAVLASKRSCMIVAEPWQSYFEVLDVSEQYEAATSELDKAALRAGVALKTAEFYSYVMSVDIYAKLLADSKAVEAMKDRIGQQVQDSTVILFRQIGCKVTLHKGKRNKGKFTVDTHLINPEKADYALAVCPQLIDIMEPLIKK